MSRWRSLAVLVAPCLLVTGLAACGAHGQAPGGASSTLTLSRCTVQSVSARCGSLSVPENPAQPNGRHIHIRVVVVPAYGAHPDPDPLFYFAGGPGGAASDSVQWASSIFHVFNELHDLVFVDQRGTGGSNAMNCPALMNVGGSASGVVPTASDEAAAARACLASTARSGDPRMYTTPIFTDDVDQVRAALGYHSIDVYGGSYGVSSGLTYIQRHGSHVRAALFDSGSLLDVPLWQLSNTAQQHALDTVLDRCEGDASCKAAFPPVRVMLFDVITRLTASPATVTVTDPHSGATRHATITASVFVGVLADYFLDNVQDAANLPAFLYAADLGDWPRLAQQLTVSAPPTNPTQTLVAAQSIICSDAWARMDPAAIRASGGRSLFTQHEVDIANARRAFCAAWPSATGASGPVRSAAPVVFLNGTADPDDPPANVAGAVAYMPNSLSVSVKDYGHGVLDQDSSRCLANDANVFLAKGVPSTAADWLCALSPPLPLFDVG